MKKILLILSAVIIILFCVIIFGYYFLKSENVKNSVSKVAVAAMTETATIQPVSSAPKKFNVLLIPGHDVKDGGANYKNIYERDLVSDIASKISDILNKEGDYNVTITRNTNSWNPIFTNYFQNEKQQIIDWKNQHQAEDKALMTSGQKKYVADMANHAEATPETSVKLYGINKWADENNIDLVINLHFNDEQRPNMNTPGDLTGFDIFIPESQMKNSTASRTAAQDIFDELKEVEPAQINKLLEDQTLIALGASGTLDAPSMLIEYAYIYEKGIRTDADREDTLQNMANQTALGIENYFKTEQQ